jgi:mannose-1-phosphate guanylyltransferase
LFQAREKIQEENFLLINADIVHEIDLPAAERFHLEQHPLATLVVKRTEDAEWKKVSINTRKEIVQLGNVSLKQEKFPFQFGFTGIHIVNRRIFDYCREKKYLCINKDLYPLACRNGEKVLAWETKDYWMDIGSKDGFEKVHRDLLLKKIGEPNHE